VPSADGYPSLSERARSLSLNLPPEVAGLLIEMAERVEQATAAEEIIARATGRHRVPPQRRDRHGLHAVQGSAAAALIWSAARAHKVLATAGVLAVGTAVAVAPSVISPHAASAMHRPPGPTASALRLTDPRAVPLAAGVRHRRLDDDDAHQIERPTPSATPTPTPSATVPVPVPSPTPSPTLPVPTPSASVPPPAARQVVLVARALAGATGLACDTMPAACWQEGR
jgi:hypothetical protein